MKPSNVIKTLTAATLLMLPLSCTDQKKEPSLYSFIDHLGHENILLSPFQHREVFPSLAGIADESSLRDSGTGENPYLLKKKLKIGQAEINALLAPPKSIYRFSMKVPARAVLEFTYGIRRDNEFEQKKKGRRIAEFSVVLESENAKTEIFKNSLTLSPDKTLVFNYKEIDLSEYEGKGVYISFNTRGSAKALAAWFNPVIYTPREDTKNVILISLDTLRPDHLGCYGYSRETSPAIDSLAEESVLFLNTFATSPWTLPSHVSLLTSLNCINHLVYYSNQRMDPSLSTLADILRVKGYSTGAITGGGFVSGLYGFNKGFDSFLIRGGAIKEKDLAGKASQAVLDWITRHKSRNFFLFLHSYQIHNPYFCPEPYNKLFLKEGSVQTKVDMGPLRLNHEKRFEPVTDEFKQNIIGLYDGEIRYTDETLIQPLLEKLKELDLFDNTMIILTSDHGEEFFEHNAWAHTHSVYNETIKIPLIIKFFKSDHAGKRPAKFARLIDIMPTILEALGVDLPKEQLDGESLFKLISDREDKLRERIVLSELASNVMDNHIPKKTAINRDQMKLILNEDYRSEDLSSFISPPPNLELIEIFDLKIDPEELKNKVQKDSQLAHMLMDFLNTHYKQKKRVRAGKAEIDKELREQLKALGYIK